MKKETLIDTGRLPQSDHTWLVAVRPARIWLRPKDRDPYRPFQMLVLDVDSDCIRESEIFEHRPDFDAVRSRLFKAMIEPAKGSGKPMRPARMVFDDVAAIRASKILLAEIGVECEYREESPIIDAVIRDFEKFVKKRDLRPSLLEVRGISLRLLEELFSAAAYFYDQAPWRRVDDECPMEIRFPADGPPRYAVVMGNAKIQFGVAFFPSLKDVRIQYSDGKAKDIYRRMTTWSLTYDEPSLMSFDDLEAIEKCDWPIPSPKAYPLFLKSSPRKQFEIPKVEEILFTAAALRAIPPFAAGLKIDDSGILSPSRDAYRLSGIYDGAEILLDFPAGLWDDQN